MDILWDEAAVLVEQVSGAVGERRIIDEGSLRQICSRLRKRQFVDLTRVTISLPDRRVPPTTYRGDALSMLLGKVPFDDPTEQAA